MQCSHVKDPNAPDPWKWQGLFQVRHRGMTIFSMLKVCTENVLHGFLLLDVYSLRLLPCRDPSCFSCNYKPASSVQMHKINRLSLPAIADASPSGHTAHPIPAFLLWVLFFHSPSPQLGQSLKQYKTAGKRHAMDGLPPYKVLAKEILEIPHKP